MSRRYSAVRFRRVVPPVFAALLLAGIIRPAEALSPFVKKVSVLRNFAGRVDWSKGTNIIAFDKQGADGYFDVYTMNPDGSGEQCITCDRPSLPNKHQGNPAFDPTGSWILFMAQKQAPDLGKLDYYANPGSGINCDVWVTDSKGQQFWQVSNTTPLVGGVLHPHFSNKGDKITWAERYAGAPDSSPPNRYGLWNIKVADFSVQNGAPVIANIKTYTPGQYHIFYETHGFSRDDSKIYFSGNLEGQDTYFINVYSLDLNTGDLVNLSNTTNQWNEHAQLTPSGNGIIWMTTSGDSTPDSPNVVSDYWLMYPDGGEKIRLTSFNDPKASEYVPNVSHVSCGDSAWSSDGNSLVATLIYDQATSAGVIARIDFGWVASTVLSANYQPAVAPESIAAAFGRGLALAQASDGSWPTALAGTKVNVQDSAGVTRPARVYFVYRDQVNYLVPSGSAPGAATVTVSIAGVNGAPDLAVATSSINISNVAPGIYTATADGTGPPAAYVQQVAPDGSQTFPNTFQCNTAGSGCIAAPIRLGAQGYSIFLDLYATGIRHASSSANVKLRINNSDLPVLFAGAQPTDIGLDQIVALLPGSLAGTGMVNVAVVVDGAVSNTVQLNLQ